MSSLRLDSYVYTLESLAQARTRLAPDGHQSRPKYLNNLANRLSNLGRREEALAASQETANLYRDLAAARPDAFTVDLARSLGARGRILRGAERHGDAAASFAEGLRLILPYARRYGPALAGLTDVLAQGWVEASEAADLPPDETLMTEVLATLQKIAPPGAADDGAA